VSVLGPFELAAFRLATSGTISSVLGASYLPMDIEVRRDYYTPAELSAMFNGLPPEMQQRYQAYAAGINAWVNHVGAEKPPAMPFFDRGTFEQVVELGS
jgi:acyl-homoserine lactone acylase PvdQ